MEKLISIGLPIVKTKFLAEAIESVLNQSYIGFELIIVNNGQTREEKENIKKIVEKYREDRIVYHENTNHLPIIKNWNLCLEYSHYKYFVLFSDDDVYEKDFLQELVYLAEKYPDVNIYHTRVRVIDSNGQTISISPICPEYETVLDFILSWICGNMLQYVPDFMCNTRKLKELGGFYNLPLAWGSDAITWITLARERGIAYSNRILCNWRFSDINLSNIGSINLRLKAVLGIHDWIDNFISNYIPNSKEEKEILTEIKSKKRINFEMAQKYLLSRLGKNCSFLNYIYKLLKLKREFSIANKIIFISIAKKYYDKIKLYSNH